MNKAEKGKKKQGKKVQVKKQGKKVQVKKAEKGKKAENKNKAENNTKNKKAESKGKKAENKNKKEKAQGENKKENAQGENPMKAMKAMMKKRRPEMLNDLGSMRSWQWEPRAFAQYCNACAKHRVQVGIVQCGACGDTN
jgi:hypothetical protein